jgi:hypothetical protein
MKNRDTYNTEYMVIDGVEHTNIFFFVETDTETSVTSEVSFVSIATKGKNREMRLTSGERGDVV